MMTTNPRIDEGELRFCGQAVSGDQWTLLTQIIKRYGSLSRNELANTVCELLDWKRPNGKLKTVECRQFFERLQTKSLIALPPMSYRGRGPSKKIELSQRSAEGEPLVGFVGAFAPVTLRLVRHDEQRRLWRELIERYHYLGYRTPFGAHLCYLIEVARPKPTVVGCMQLSSPAWRMAPRDRWIGWQDAERAAHLQRIVNNSRFLILPWARIKNLASHALSLLSRCITNDWQANYHIAPVLLETLVDTRRFTGCCYRAANWIDLGQTSGRGRQDRAHGRHGAAPKKIFVYRLRADATGYLRGGHD